MIKAVKGRPDRRAMTPRRDEETAAMTVLEKEQARALAHEDLTPYRGRWVALREGRVIASDVDGESLRDNPEVGPDDVLTPVPAHEEGSYLL
jgi:hypothetical protein